MDIIAKVVKYVNYPLWIYKNNSLRLKYMKEFERNQFLLPTEFKKLQWQRLKKIMKQAYDKCPFYRRRFDSVNINPDLINSYHEFEKIPLLSKTDLQDNYKEMIAESYSEKTIIKDMSGGSTGMPVVFYYTRDRLDSREAATMRHDRWAGWDIGERVAVLWGAARDLHGPTKLHTKIRQQLLRKALVLDASSLTREKMVKFSKQLKKYRPKIILAYANTLYLFAKFLEENGITGINPKGIISSAEVLLPENRKFIESIFNCKVFNRYGCREVMLIASECEYHNGMHINADSLYVEFIKNGKNVINGEEGEIVITDLLNYGMPLIRYRIGDVGKPLAGDCACGRSLPLMDMVQGRVTDFIRTPEGKIVSGVALATYLITNIPGIKQVQLHQNDIKYLKVKVVKNNYYDQETEKELLNRLNKFIGNSIISSLEFVENIPVEASGKYRFCISNISKEY